MTRVFSCMVFDQNGWQRQRTQQEGTCPCVQRVQGHPSPSSPGKERSQHHCVTTQQVTSDLPGDLRLLCPGNSLAGKGPAGGFYRPILSQQAKKQPGVVTGVLLQPRVLGASE